MKAAAAKKPPLRLQALEETFLYYVNEEKDDVQAAALVSAVLREAALHIGLRRFDAGTERFRDEETQQALILLKQLPEATRNHRSQFEGEFPLTRRALWEQLIVGIMLGSENSLAHCLEGLLLPVSLSDNEEKQLKELFGERLRIDHYHAKKLFKALRKYRGSFNGLSMRRLLCAVISRVDFDELLSIVGKLSAVK